jgi:predicted glycosyltransferase
MRVWVDCTAAAHPLVLRPIVERLRARGHEVEITAREFGQTVGILDRLGLEHEVFGAHGESTAAKASALASRSSALARWARPRRFDLAVGHGSVDLAVVSTLLRIPSAQMQDYEHAGLQRQLAFRAARRVLAPDAIPVAAMRRAGAAERKLVRYPGLKEDYYLADFEPDPAVLDELGLDEGGILVVVRPPPESSAYHAENPLYDGVLDRVINHGGATAIVIPRTEGQRASAAQHHSRGEPVVVPDHAIDAQSLIAFADVVVSAGGTMNREAVALGTPVHTIFTGRMGAVDEDLVKRGLLKKLGDPADLPLRKRERPAGVQNPRDAGLLVDGIMEATQRPLAGGQTRFRASRRSSDT